jgi:hypothetical protein
METVVNAGDDIECTSVCALIWLAGQPRTAFQGARIGFHAAHDGVGNTVGGGNALVGAYLSQLGFSYETIHSLAKTAPHDMNYLTADKAKEYGITYNFIPAPPEWVSAPPPPIYQNKVPGNPVKTIWEEGRQQ